MLFNSYSFLLVFLPITILLFFWLGRINTLLGSGVLFLASLVFYGWWDVRYIGLLLISIIFNFAIGTSLTRLDSFYRRRLLVLGVSVNLLVLGYYKYAGFFLDTVRAMVGGEWQTIEIALPLGISFFTFTQIAFLVDAYRNQARELNIIYYGLFVTYFPHLIAGPVLHHKEMMPQFARQATYRPDFSNFAIGLTIFIIGLFKKVCVADSVSGYSSAMFASVGEGGAVSFVEAWGGALAYTIQLYFDFSGYSDMAIGLSRLFGVILPLNFNSPYKAKNIIEFWRRWHMTLSRFLRDYLYIPLGGSRNGVLMRFRNLLVTMLLGGLWHGAGWTFVVWGGLHGFYLVINHGWQALVTVLRINFGRLKGLVDFLGWVVTFVAVIVAWVFFRAPDLTSAVTIISAMFSLPTEIDSLRSFYWYFISVDIDIEMWVWIGVFLTATLTFPNTQQIMHHFKPALDAEQAVMEKKWFHWEPNKIWVLVISLMGILALPFTDVVSEFLYFQF